MRNDLLIPIKCNHYWRGLILRPIPLFRYNTISTFDFNQIDNKSILNMTIQFMTSIHCIFLYEISFFINRYVYENKTQL